MADVERKPILCAHTIEGIGGTQLVCVLAPGHPGDHEAADATRWNTTTEMSGELIEIGSGWIDRACQVVQAAALVLIAITLLVR